MIIGGGGYFLELHEYIESDIKTGVLSEVSIKGVLDDKRLLLSNGVPYLGPVASYVPKENDVFIIAIGNVNYRSDIYTDLKSKGAKFISYVHPSSIVSKSAILGEGCIVCPMSIINANAVLGSNVSINVNVSIGHGASVGSHSVLSPYSALNGDASVGEKVFIGTRSTVFPCVDVGADTVVDSHTAVRKTAGPKLLLSDRANFVSVNNRFLR